MSDFKKLYKDFLNNKGEPLKQSDKKQIKCYVRQSYPYFIVSDLHFFVPCYFTKKAISDFKSARPDVSVTDLKG